MLLVEDELDISEEVVSNVATILETEYDIPAGKACIFDIETTGLSSKVSNVYLIGVAYIHEEKAYYKQFFADDYTSEKALLESFSEMLEDFDAVVHFNGTTFDIPYLEDKCAKHGLPSPFIRLESIDLYKIVSKKRYIFPTENCKLISIEKFTGFDRGEDADGGECINIYTEYMKHKFARETGEQERCFQTVLKHNRDDLIGTVTATQAIVYVEHIPGVMSVSVSDEKVTISDILPKGMRYPTGLEYNFVSDTSRRQKNIKTKRRVIDDAGLVDLKNSNIINDKDIDEANEIIYLNNDNNINEKSNIKTDIKTDYQIIFRIFGNCLSFSIPIEEGERYHFYSDYKNYFYLPDEDMAVHKSVGTYVDKEHREKATAANCYVKKTGKR